ncbi:MAG: hypothetical protein E7183_06045 [Erysipelotrichaceae bacterium]|nr:hypothetical protein [Erysipelotrichaceae bacterium]
MNKKLVKRCYLILVRFMSFLLSLFAVYVGCYAVISLGVFKQYIFPINYLSILFFTACIVAAILTVVLYFDKINFIVQAVLIYVIVTISIYFVGFYTNCFTTDKNFWLFSLIINLIGLTLLFGVIIIKRTLENRDLNKKLQKYQERDK